MTDKTILLIDDDAMTRLMLREHLKQQDYKVLEAETAETGLSTALEKSPDLILLDIVIPEMGGEALLARLMVQCPQIPVIILTGSHDTDLAVRCIKNGAMDFLTKPVDAARLVTTVENILHLKVLENRLVEVQGTETKNSFDMLYGASAVMRRLFEQLRIVSQSDIGVLVEGPSGTGKELVARALHRKGPRKDGPFVALNCGAIPETMLESELFGHERGAFTGAAATHIGCFEQANRGTLFLDEIGEMRPDMQVRLLRALENREIRRLGGTKTIQVDLRVVAATNKDLRACVTANTFREDLYYRLAVYRLSLSPLAARDGDMIQLAERFMVEYSAKQSRRYKGFAPETAALLRSYAWPGNVRELRNAIERAVLIAEGPYIQPHDLPEEIVNHEEGEHDSPRPVLSPATVASSAESPCQPDAVAAIIPMAKEEERILRRALSVTRGDVTRAAAMLEIGRATLYRRIKELQIDVKAP